MLEEGLDHIQKVQGNIKGVFHLAGVIDDATLLNQSEASFKKYLRQKYMAAGIYMNSLSH